MVDGGSGSWPWWRCSTCCYDIHSPVLAHGALKKKNIIIMTSHPLHSISPATQLLVQRRVQAIKEHIDKIMGWTHVAAAPFVFFTHEFKTNVWSYNGVYMTVWYVNLLVSVYACFLFLGYVSLLCKSFLLIGKLLGIYLIGCACECTWNILYMFHVYM